MPPPTLITAKAPVLSSLDRGATAVVGRIRFGDGYAQRQNNGPPDISQALAWPPMALADARALVAFFEAWAGSEAFFYTINADRGVELFTCGDWRESEPSRGLVAISASFTRERDIV